MDTNDRNSSGTRKDVRWSPYTKVNITDVLYGIMKKLDKINKNNIKFFLLFFVNK